MKIRIKGNSIRYRLTKSEVRQLSETHSIQDTTQFADQTLTYAIEARHDITHLSATFQGTTITLHFPAAEASAWYTSERITYKDDMVLPNGTILRLLLEKDFVCLDHTDEDQSDNYANPNKTC